MKRRGAQEGEAVLIRRADAIDRLGPAAQSPVTVDLVDEPLHVALDAISRAGGFEVIALEEVDLEQRVNLQVSGGTVKEALRLLAEATGIVYSVDDAGRLQVWSGPFRVGGAIEVPERVEYVAPRYPEEARRLGVAGTVVLEIHIDRDGNVGDVQVLRGVREDLDQAAIDAVRQWRYGPARYQGQAVEMLLTVTVQFHLR